MKKERILILFSLFVILATIFSLSSTGAKTLLSNKTYTEGTSIEVDGDFYKLTVGSANDTPIAFKKDNKTILLSLEDCMFFGEYLVCYTEKTATSTIRLETFFSQAALSVNRSMNKSELILGEDATVWIEINNSGDIQARDIYLVDNLPEGIIFVSSDGGSYNSSAHKVYWRGVISGGAMDSFTYVVKPNRVLEEYIKGNLTYSNKGTNEFLEFVDMPIVSYLPFIFEVNTSDKEITIGGNFTFYFNISNNNTENITLTLLEIDMNNSFELISSKNVLMAPTWINDTLGSIINSGRLFSESAGKVKGGLVLEQNETLMLNITLRAIDPYTPTVPLRITYAAPDSPNRTFTLHYPVIVSFEKVVPQIYFSPDELESLQEAKMTVRVRNPNPNFDMESYSAVIKSDLVEPIQYDVEKEYDETVVLFEKTFQIPEVYTPTKYYVEVTVSYKTEFGEKQSVYSRKEVVVNPLGNIVITKELKQTARAGKNVSIIEVYLENALTRGLTDVAVKEILSEEVYYRGETISTIDLLPGAKKKVYEYEIIVPPDEEGLGKELVSTTEVLYSVAGRELTATKTLLIPVDSVLSHQSKVFLTDEAIDEFITKDRENASNRVDTVTVRPIFDVDPSTVYILFIGLAIIMILLFDFYVMKKKGIGIFFFMKRLKLFEFDEKVTRSKYLGLAGKIKELESRQRKGLMIKLELESKLRKMRDELSEREHVMPKEIARLESQKEDIMDRYRKLESKKAVLEAKISLLKQKEDVIVKEETDLDNQKQEIMLKQNAFKAQKEKITSDITQIESKMVEVDKKLVDIEQTKVHGEKAISKLKKNKIALLKERINLIKLKRRNLLKQNVVLTENEEEIEKIKERIKKDLDMSENEVKDAEYTSVPKYLVEEVKKELREKEKLEAEEEELRKRLAKIEEETSVEETKSKGIFGKIKGLFGSDSSKAKPAQQSQQQSPQMPMGQMQPQQIPPQQYQPVQQQYQQQQGQQFQPQQPQQQPVVNQPQQNQQLNLNNKQRQDNQQQQS